jgi:hypothetical protein
LRVIVGYVGQRRACEIVVDALTGMWLAPITPLAP